MAIEAPATQDGFSLPTRIGRYRILTPLGSGGMAMVLLARAEGIGGFERDVAIKVLHPHLMEDESLVAQFLKEARIAARIRHPNVVPVLDVGRHSQGVHLVMEYVQGDSLHGLARRARRQGDALPDGVRMRVLTEALLGLHEAHELCDEKGTPLGVVHRDFTPHNILVGTDGAARLCDFGVVKVIASNDKTATGIVKGKLRFLAPEQVRARPLDRRCDVWAAGVTAWELLTGKQLYDQRDQVDVLLRIATEPPPPLRSVRPDLSAAVDEAVAWALTLDPEERCPSAEALRERLIEAWTADQQLASQTEVATCVQQLCAARLEELRGKIDKFSHLLDEMGELVQPLEGDPTPSGEEAGQPLSTKHPKLAELQGLAGDGGAGGAGHAGERRAGPGRSAVRPVQGADGETATVPIRRQIGSPAAESDRSAERGPKAEIPTVATRKASSRATTSTDEGTDAEIPTVKAEPVEAGGESTGADPTDSQIPTAVSPSAANRASSIEDTEAGIPTARAPNAAEPASIREDTEAEIPTVLASAAAAAPQPVS
ncbi:MAG: protein kinase, partial [Deltaproteobacteria bacterium]|nr:protein kinase [Deltaproteobacteria bacterium]MBW2532780.1 protein kinase [Deltaproteobacteria bacterium]